MKKTDYAAKLLDPRWQKKRLEVLERFKWTCADCGETSRTFHVHHRYYVKGREPWDYPDLACVALCADCHKTWPSYWNGDGEDGGVNLEDWEILAGELVGETLRTDLLGLASHLHDARNMYGVTKEDLAYALEIALWNACCNSPTSWFTPFVDAARARRARLTQPKAAGASGEEEPFADPML